MLVPIVVGTTSAWYRCGLFPAIVMLILGLSSASVVFRILCDGMSTSNQGTWFRETEPAKYWLDVVIWSIGYILVASAGYFIQPE